MPRGQVESGMELPLLQPLRLCAQCSFWTQRCAVPSWGPLSLTHGVMAGAQGRQPGPAGQGVGVC